jgi:leader peptidase (prepilin peptidase)/N-methyltransferase
VELATGVLFAAVAFAIGPHAALPAFLYLAAIAVALTMIDIDTRRLPNAIVLPSYVVGGALLTVAAAVSGEWDSLLRAALGGAALFAFYFALAFIYPAGMGFGDVKLAGVLGLYLGWLGWGALAVGAFAAFLLGGVLGAGLMLVGKAGRKTAIPFGPWMLAGAMIAVFVGQQLADAYRRNMLG